MLYLVSYDVVDDGQRRRIQNCLKDYGRRVQYSVYECELSEDEVPELWGKLAREVDATQDSVRRYRLCGGCEREVTILGKGDRYSEPGFVVI